MTMKSGVSYLNPNAECYIPLALRDVSNTKKGHDPKTMAGMCVQDTQRAHHEDSKLKGQQFDSLDLMANKSLTVDDSEMDLAYLQMSFPDVSEQSLIDVYQANEYDLEAAIDMLIHLEPSFHPTDLPEALGIGDIPVPAAAAAHTGDFSPVEVKHVVGEPSTSSGSSDSAVAS